MATHHTSTESRHRVRSLNASIHTRACVCVAHYRPQHAGLLGSSVLMHMGSSVSRRQLFKVLVPSKLEAASKCTQEQGLLHTPQQQCTHTSAHMKQETYTHRVTLVHVHSHARSCNYTIVGDFTPVEYHTAGMADPLHHCMPPYKNIAQDTDHCAPFCIHITRLD